MAKTSFADIVTDWEQLLSKVTANTTDLSFLEDSHATLTTVLQSAKDASARQSTFRAQFQQATRDLEDNLAKGRDLATRLRNGVRTRYGLKAEKLTDFNLRPRRPGQKAKKTPTPVPAPPAAAKE
ncbi:MAG TPA: hypothetical protein VH988_11570 [Thermoanaerobaculia bacterium]|jgi:hypothetical protein|nr:hypothetical protein [Thermoanaerobaculia bacterium]